MVLLIDNYDSFSYNLYQLIGCQNPEIRVIRNDEMSLGEIQKLPVSHIVLSPGPGRPQQAGICMELVRQLGGQIPILGVCLGHQAIFEAFGGTVSHAEKLMHGKQSEVLLSQSCPLFQGLGASTQVARYHSLAAVPATLPACLRVVASTAEGEIMAVMHTEKPIYGLQFHPESILTTGGERMIQNFLEVRV